jgi:nitric oxide reductase subunit C
MNCHSLQGTGGTFGPALDHVGGRKTLKEIEHYIRDPKGVNPKSQMPPQKELSARELEEVAKFLSSLK